MGKIIVNGVDGNFGGHAAQFILKEMSPENLIFTGYNMEPLKKYEDMGIETRHVDYADGENLYKVFEGGDVLLILSLPIVGKERLIYQKNAVDAAKKAGVKRVVYTSYAGAGDDKNECITLIDHNATEAYIKASGLKYNFLRDSQYADAIFDTVMSTAYDSGEWVSNQGDGKVGYIAREDCALAAVALLLGKGEDNTAYTVCGPELLTCAQCMEIASDVIGKKIEYKNISDDALFAQFDEMGVPRTTDDMSKSPWPWCSEDMVSNGRAIRYGEMEIMTDDFEKLTGKKPFSMRYLFERKYGKK